MLQAVMSIMCVVNMSALNQQSIPQKCCKPGKGNTVMSKMVGQSSVDDKCDAVFDVAGRLSTGQDSDPSLSMFLS